MNLRTEISLLGMLTIETVLLTVYSSQPQRAFTSKSSLHNYRPLRFSRCSHAQQKVLLSSFSASDNVLVTYVLTVKRRGCQIFSTLRSGGPLADDRQVGLDRALFSTGGGIIQRGECACDCTQSFLSYAYASTHLGAVTPPGYADFSAI